MRREEYLEGEEEKGGKKLRNKEGARSQEKKRHQRVENSKRKG
jgi:hypothetical protein